jgi:peptidyl-tRNA hydrolase
MSSTSPLVQYIVVRKDLAWPAGALIAQACHAATSVIHMFYNNKDTQDYLADIDNMHKIVLQVSKNSFAQSFLIYLIIIEGIFFSF